jgi:hypothetical protein
MFTRTRATSEPDPHLEQIISTKAVTKREPPRPKVNQTNRNMSSSIIIVDSDVTRRTLAGRAVLVALYRPHDHSEHKSLSPLDSPGTRPNLSRRVEEELGL